MASVCRLCVTYGGAEYGSRRYPDAALAEGVEIMRRRRGDRNAKPSVGWGCLLGGLIAVSHELEARRNGSLAEWGRAQRGTHSSGFAEICRARRSRSGLGGAQLKGHTDGKTHELAGFAGLWNAHGVSVVVVFHVNSNYHLSECAAAR